MQECRRTKQTCLFIHYPVSNMHTIICVSKLVILFLITLANKGKKQSLLNDRIAETKQSFIEAVRFRAIYMYGPFHSELTEEHNRNRVARPVLGLYTTWSIGTQLSVPVLNILWTENNFEYQYSTFSTSTQYPQDQ